MKYTSLDKVVRSQLMQSGYSLHWYLQFLKYAADFLREASFDTLRIINTVKLPVNSYKAVTLPCSYVDFISVAIPQGQYMQPLVSSPSINNLPHYNDQGEITTYPNIYVSNNNAGDIFGIGFLGYNWVTWNEYNEPTGRLYGLGEYPPSNGFKVIPERNIIQLDDNSCAKDIILVYISDGQDCDSASRVDAYSQAAMEHYLIFCLKKFGRQYSIGEVEEAERRYYNQLRILRARKNDLTLTDIKNLVLQNARPSIKA